MTARDTLLLYIFCVVGSPFLFMALAAIYERLLAGFRRDSR